MTRTEVKQIRLSPTEKDEIEARAKADGIDVSEYLRRSALAERQTYWVHPPNVSETKQVEARSYFEAILTFNGGDAVGSWVVVPQMGPILTFEIRERSAA